MPPKRKAATKAKTIVPNPVEDLSESVTSNFTARRPIVNGNDNDTEETTLSIIEKTANMNVTVVLEKMPDSVTKKELIEPESESVEDDEVSNKKLLQKKVTKGKPKLKKQTPEDEDMVKKRHKRATSADNEVKVVEKAMSKTKKRLLDKDASDFSKLPTSPIELPKRQQRAASVDVIPSNISKVPKETVVTEDVQKKNKKGVLKKNTKKVVNEEKENSQSPEHHNIDELLSNVLDKPKSKKGTKKDKTITHEEEQIVEDEAVKFDTVSSKSRGAAKKVKQVTASAIDVEKKSKRKPPKSTQKNNSEDQSGGTNETDDSGSVPKSPELKPKRVYKGKKNDKSPDKPEGSGDKNDTDDSFISPKIKQKRARKGKSEQKEEINGKDNKMTKPRGGRRAKNEDIEEVLLQSPPANSNEDIETGDLPDSLPSTLESEKSENKPVVVKRKTKAKTGKK